MKEHFIKKIANPYILVGLRNHFLLAQLKIKMERKEKKEKKELLTKRAHIFEGIVAMKLYYFEYYELWLEFLLQDMFDEKRSILEPAGALAIAGTKAYCKYYGL